LQVSKTHKPFGDNTGELHGDEGREGDNTLTEEDKECTSSSSTNGATTKSAAELSVDDKDEEHPEGNGNRDEEVDHVEDLGSGDLVLTESLEQDKNGREEKKDGVNGTNASGGASSILGGGGNAGVLNEDANEDYDDADEADLGEKSSHGAGRRLEGRAVVDTAGVGTAVLRSGVVTGLELRSRVSSSHGCAAAGDCAGIRAFVHNVVGSHGLSVYKITLHNKWGTHKKQSLLHKKKFNRISN